MTSPRRRSSTRSSKAPSGAAASARWLAFLALQAFEQRGAFVSKVLDELFEARQVDPRERRLATELANEVVRRRLTLDKILSRYVSRPRESVEDELWWLLRLGCCQLVCLPHIPVHAAVHETVQLCDLVKKDRAKPFINGVLRTLERELTQAGADQPESPSVDGADLLPLVQLQGLEWSVRAVRFARPVFTDPHVDSRAWLSEVASLPRWLIDRWHARFADNEKLRRTSLWLTTQGRMSLRVNLLQTTREKMLEVLEAAGVPAVAGPLPESINLLGSAVVGNISGFREGWFSVQDESAMNAVDLLDPQPGDTILDVCSAPGGKTAHLAERLRGSGQVIACDISDARLRSVDENVTRLKLQNVHVQQIHPSGEDLPAGPFDAILLDVPCSNTGVLGKRAEARWRLVPASLAELVDLQKRLLRDSLSRVKPGGKILYSTCSIDQDENEGVVHAVLADHPEFRVESVREHWPGTPADGGYQTLLIRSGN
ncbi:transcription antitermination factor NusB [Planctomicrobium sp. SH664]|uniref:transcription antitermination factor NusB n=1 Tax=Planctomicrobium sp. SH664 TaxID=3448125 RepID=UPI003F5BFDA8